MSEGEDRNKTSMNLRIVNEVDSGPDSDMSYVPYSTYFYLPAVTDSCLCVLRGTAEQPTHIIYLFTQSREGQESRQRSRVVCAIFIVMIITITDHHHNESKNGWGLG